MGFNPNVSTRVLDTVLRGGVSGWTGQEVCSSVSAHDLTSNDLVVRDGCQGCAVARDQSTTVYVQPKRYYNLLKPRDSQHGANA